MSDFDFVGHYGATTEETSDELLSENTAVSAINCGFVGLGGGGGKLAKAFIDLGFSKTLLVNTTEKDQPEGVDPKHLVIIPDSDGVGKDVVFGKKVLKDNGTVVEDALRTKLGKVDWLFVLTGGGGGTGSAAIALKSVFERYLKSIQASGTVIYIATIPTAQESLNDTIRNNANSLLKDISNLPHLALSNEKQVQMLRGKVGMLNLYPAANTAFAKMLGQVLKLSSESSPIQTFDSKDLEKCLKTKKRMLLGTALVQDPSVSNLGATIFQNCIKQSPCPVPQGKPDTGAILFVVTPEMANNPEVSKHIDAAISYVGGRTKTLFSGVYIKENIPGLIAILTMGGLDWE
jgi:cell division GTPase FtsZ